MFFLLEFSRLENFFCYRKVFVYSIFIVKRRLIFNKILMFIDIKFNYYKMYICYNVI